MPNSGAKRLITETKLCVINQAMKIFCRLIKRRLEYIRIGRKCGCTKIKLYVDYIYTLLYVQANPERKRLFGRKVVDREIILIWILKKYNGRTWAGFIWLRIGTRFSVSLAGG
jgi:hypothetical protein